MYTSEHLVEGQIYTRKELKQQFEITDANLNNGIFRPFGHQSIWLFVTEEKSQDLPPLHDLLEGDTLYWSGQPMGRTDKLVMEHIANGDELVVFYRKRRDTYPGSGFKYEGRFSYASHEGERPTHFVLQKQERPIEDIVGKDLEALWVEEDLKTIYREGKAITKLINTHERNPKLRAETIRIHGTRCQVCDFSFTEKYGIHGEGYIEVHHLKPVANYTSEIDVDASQDMAVICANCHRMIHRNPERPLTLDELREIVISAVEPNHKP